MTSRTRELLIVGAGGLARETAEVVRAINAVHPTWNLSGFLDDDHSKHGSVYGGVPVVGPSELVHDWPDAKVVVPVASPTNYVNRRIIVQKLALEDDRYATLIHPTATFGASCEIGVGSVLLAHVDLTSEVTIGRHVAVMPQVVLPHEVRVDDWATVCSGVRLGGGCHIYQGAYLGGAVCVREGLKIGEWAMVGMGSVVTRDVPAKRLWYGAPARDISGAPLPAEMMVV